MAGTRPYQHVLYLERDSIERGRIEVRRVEEFEFQDHDYGQNSNVDENIPRFGCERRLVWPFGLHPYSHRQRVGICLGVCCMSERSVPAPIKE